MLLVFSIDTFKQTKKLLIVSLCKTAVRPQGKYLSTKITMFQNKIEKESRKLSRKRSVVVVVTHHNT